MKFSAHRFVGRASNIISHSIQNVNYLLQFHLWNSPPVSVQSPSTLYSSKTVMIHIGHMHLCHPSCKHKNIWGKIVFLTLAHLFGIICLQHSATLILLLLLRLPSGHTCSITISKLFFTLMMALFRPFKEVI